MKVFYQVYHRSNLEVILYFGCCLLGVILTMPQYIPLATWKVGGKHKETSYTCRIVVFLVSILIYGFSVSKHAFCGNEECLIAKPQFVL